MFDSTDHTFVPLILPPYYVYSDCTHWVFLTLRCPRHPEAFVTNYNYSDKVNKLQAQQTITPNYVTLTPHLSSIKARLPFTAGVCGVPVIAVSLILH